MRTAGTLFVLSPSERVTLSKHYGVTILDKSRQMQLNVTLLKTLCTWQKWR